MPVSRRIPAIFISLKRVLLTKTLRQEATVTVSRIAARQPVVADNLIRRHVMNKKVAVIMGSDSDLPVVKKAIDCLKKFDIPVEAHIMSAHRTPEKACEFAKNARSEGFGVIIAAAGMAAHLAGVLAAHTTLPVIGIPCLSPAFDGMDSLLSTVQMPKGIPVATVAVNGAENAGILAAQILGVYDERIAAMLFEEKEEMIRQVVEKDENLQSQI